MTDFLLELRSEEIPARMQAGARADLERLFREQLEAAGVAPGEVTVWSTPRRLALIARGLPEQTEAVSEEAKGPPEGAPDQAVDGFCRKNGVTRDQLELREVKGRNTYFAVIDKPGRAVSDVLAEAIPAIVRAFPWPKSMRWGAASISTESLRWVRPLSGIVAIFGEELVACEVGGVQSGYATMGHRFHHEGEITIGSADDYADKLRACHVIVDHEERQDIVRDGAKKAAAEAGLDLVEDEGLVIENAGLTEWPVPLLGRFDEEFLAVPPEVIQLTARTNQKYFVCEQGGKLANAFVCTANIEAADGGEAIVAGNRKVLAARLSDARFFWEQDLKKPLEEHAKGLARITFHEKLGTVADKVERVAKLAEWLANEKIVPDCDPALARQAAELCKADLVTEMVGEFPELQGLMGGYYARAEGLPDAVADAIRDHYKPVGQGDEVPTAPVTVAVSLADKLDTLVGFFRIEERPTGSKDPFALRRAALGAISLITKNGLRSSMYNLFHAALGKSAEVDMSAVVAADYLKDFFVERLKVQQREAGVRHDLIDAVDSLGGDDDIGGERDLVRLLARVHALQDFIGTEDGTNLLAGYKRAANILKKEGFESASDQVSLSYTPEPAEKALMDALDSAGPRAAQAVEDEDFSGAMAALATLRAPIDAFFDDVTVNDADENKRKSRLALLDRFRVAVHNVADFSKIEG
ncbi:MAG: glycine--tRNA ligase subunit beta [Sphingomonadaceae bacterium]